MVGLADDCQLPPESEQEGFVLAGGLWGYLYLVSALSSDRFQFAPGISQRLKMGLYTEFGLISMPFSFLAFFSHSPESLVALDFSPGSTNQNTFYWSFRPSSTRLWLLLRPSKRTQEVDPALAVSSEFWHLPEVYLLLFTFQRSQAVVFWIVCNVSGYYCKKASWLGASWILKQVTLVLTAQQQTIPGHSHIQNGPANTSRSDRVPWTSYHPRNWLRPAQQHLTESTPLWEDTTQSHTPLCFCAHRSGSVSVKQITMWLNMPRKKMDYCRIWAGVNTHHLDR
jgi:hypothetical protein